ncbi:MAG: hypothetical protein QM657_10595 [Lacrimispora sp.]|uniref:hypothetical protein n=1 Tax=Lacrimispora sp. TaxID=2719234 RepID=UPI0039E4BBD1
MKDLLEKWNTKLTAETRRFLKFLAIPLAAVLLIVVIIVLDKSGPEQGPAGNMGTGSEAQPPGNEGGESTDQEPAEADFTLQEEAIPEIHDLMESYFKARKICDPELLNQVYGGTYSQEQIGEQIARMEEEVKFYRGFENLICYTVPGADDGDYLVYAKFDIMFRQADTLAPSLILCYAKTAEAGTYYLVGEVSPAQSKHMEEANQSEAVQAMAKEVNESLEKALKSDENLLAVYHTLTDEIEETEETSETEETESGSQPDNM